MEEFVIYAEKPINKEWEYVDIPAFILVAALLGILTSLHTRAMLAVTAFRQRMTVTLRHFQPAARMLETILYAALCASLSATVALLDPCTKKGESDLQYVAFNCPEGEYNTVASLLVTTSHSSVKLLFSGNNAGEIAASSSFVAFVTYFLLQVGLSGLPVPGGAFTATMLLGGLFGRCIGELFRDMGIVSTASGVYAVVGSAAMLSGFKQMTLASVLIVVECVNDLRLAPVVMLGVAVSLSVNWRMNERGHDEEQIVRKGLPFLEGEAPHELDNESALGLCDPLPEDAILPPEASLAEVRRALVASQVNYFPIRDGPAGSPCIGVLARARLEAALTAACGGREPAPDPRSLGGVEMAGDGAFDHDVDMEGESCPNLSRINRGENTVPLHYLMDPTPFTVVEDMPVPRLYSLFTKAGERAVVVTSIRGELRGIISREGLIDATRRPAVV